MSIVGHDDKGGGEGGLRERSPKAVSSRRRVTSKSTRAAARAGTGREGEVEVSEGRACRSLDTTTRAEVRVGGQTGQGAQREGGLGASPDMSRRVEVRGRRQAEEGVAVIAHDE